MRNIKRSIFYIEELTQCTLLKNGPPLVENNRRGQLRLCPVPGPGTVAQLPKFKFIKFKFFTADGRMSSSKIKLQLKFQGAVLDRKCVFFRPCHPNQIADAVRIICGLQDAHARFSLLDEDGDLVAISDSLAPGVYEVVLDNNDSNSSINNHNSINNSHSSSSTSSTSSASSTNSSSSSYGNGNISGANNSSCHPRNTRGSRNPRQHTSSFTSASTASSGAAGARRLASSEASVSTASDNRRPSSSSSSASGFPRGSGNRGYPPPNNPYHQDHRGDGENRTSASHSNNSRRASSASASGSGTGGVSKRDTANTASSSEWDRRSNQVQREDIARRYQRGSPDPMAAAPQEQKDLQHAPHGPRLSSVELTASIFDLGASGSQALRRFLTAGACDGVHLRRLRGW